jgi:two-component system NarL family sensor kinase
VEECELARLRRTPVMIAAGLRQLMRGGIDEFRFEYASDFIEGSWFSMRGTRFGVGADLRLWSRMRTSVRIKGSESASRRLTGQLMRSQDDERRLISRELHDSTAQNPLGASLRVAQALRLVPRLKRTAKAALEESRALIDESQREIRTVSYLLHPPMLDVAGCRRPSDGSKARQHGLRDLSAEI